MISVSRRLAAGLLFALASTAGLAQFEDGPGDSAWYAGFRAGLSTTIDSHGEFVGTTQAVYGGSPLVEMDIGRQYALLLGREVSSSLRLELEVSYLAFESDSAPVPGSGLRSDDVFRVNARLDSTMVLAKIGYDFGRLNWWVDPYFRVGFGLAATTTDARQSVELNSQIWAGAALGEQRRVEKSFPEGTASEFAWDLAVGVGRQLNDRWGVRLEYSYLNRGEAWTGTSEDGDAIAFSDLESQLIAFGIHWRFQ